MRIAYFLTHPIQYQVPMIRYLRAGGLEVEVVYQSLAGAEKFFDPGFQRDITWDVPLLEGYPYQQLPEGASFPKLISACVEALDKSHAQAVWMHGWGSNLAKAVRLAARKRGLPVLLRGETHLRSLRGAALKRWVHKAVLSRAFRSIDHFLAIGSANRDFYLDYGVEEQRITVMPYAVDNAFFQERCLAAKPQREALRESLGLTAGSPVILYCGKLIPEKSPEVLLQALAEVSQANPGNPKASLLYVGDGIMRGHLEEQAKTLAPGQVHFLGFRNQTELPALYELCDLFVLPSIFEPWGLVVNEVMNAGKPVIVSDHVGCGPDLVTAGENGAIFPANDVSGLSKILEDLLKDPIRLEEAGARSLQKINQWGFTQCLTGMQSALQNVAIS
jgi:glycosyltransferase involved in cell wall biosynthesis